MTLKTKLKSYKLLHPQPIDATVLECYSLLYKAPSFQGIVYVLEAICLMRDCASVYADFHRTAPYVITGSVDLSVKIWECR